MVSGIDDAELRRRTLAGIASQIEVLGSSVHRDRDLVAGVTPATPDRSIFNSVAYRDPATLSAQLDDLAGSYVQAGIGAWTVWVPDDDRATVDLLELAGHTFDGAPRLMALPLAERLPAPPLPEGFELGEGDAATLAILNDRAYGIEGPGWAAALKDREPSSMAILLARRDGNPAACVGTIESGDDLVISAVATDPAFQGRRLCSAILGEAMARAAARGLSTSSLQASKAGAGVYERLGYRDVGAVELWERRAAAAPAGS